MDIALVMKVAGVGMIVTVCCQVLSKAGRDEQAMLVSLSGLVLVLMLLIGELGELFDSVRRVFGL